MTRRARQDGPGRVVAIHLAPEHAGPMVAVDRVTAEAGVGLVGDRFHGSRHRHVSLVESEHLVEIADALGRGVPDGGTRRNLTVQGLALPTSPDDRPRLGEVELEVVRIAAPCARMDESIGTGAKAAMHRRGGIICRILTGGTIEVGTPVERDDPTDR